MKNLKDSQKQWSNVETRNIETSSEFKAAKVLVYSALIAGLAMIVTFFFTANLHFGAF